MTAAVSLQGLTWDHPRGHAPLAESASRRAPAGPLPADVSVAWSARTLQEFGAQPLSELARRFDLLVVDHPFCGTLAAQGLALDLRQWLSEADLQAFAADSAGPCWTSYAYAGGQWALPLDASMHTCAWRPDLLETLGSSVPSTWDEVLQLASAASSRGMGVAVPLGPTDAACTFLTLCASLGKPWPVGRSGPDPDANQQALAWLRRFAEVGLPISLRSNPVQLLDAMQMGDAIAYVPFLFAYLDYARRPAGRVRFGPVPAAVAAEPGVPILGGTGLAVSASCRHPVEALRYASTICASAYQSSSYFIDGGQPASRQAWQSPELDAETGGFFAANLGGLETAYVRPRYHGFVPWFEAVGAAIHCWLLRGGPAEGLAGWIQTSYEQAQANAPAGAEHAFCPLAN